MKNENNNNVVWHNATVTWDHRQKLNEHRSVNLWFTGMSGSGKSTLAHTIEERLYQTGCRTFVFDGDNVRHGLCSDLGFSQEERFENIRRIAEMVKLFLNAGVIAIRHLFHRFGVTGTKHAILLAKKILSKFIAAALLKSVNKEKLRAFIDEPWQKK